jgi:NAD(P)-dependent dehydrogenase (short-subunit alcohol dehydrogenase family)
MKSQKRLLITSSSRGIGLELCRQYAMLGGWQVLATSRNQSPDLESLIAEYPTFISWLEFDVSSDQSANRLKETLNDTYLNLVVCNAGALKGYQDGIEDLDSSDLSTMYDVNVLGVIRTIQATLNSLRKAPSSTGSDCTKIASISSKVGSIADNQGGMAYGYRASKAALNMVNKSLSIELAPENICTVVLHPGWVQTEMGGANAPTSTTESANGLIEVIDRLTPEHSGKFFDFRGEAILW